MISIKYNKEKNKFFEEKRVVNSGIIIFNKDKILLIKRKDKKHWELPGGKVKLIDQGKTKKDTLKNAAIREVFEEVGLKPRIITRYSPFYIDFTTPDNVKRRSYNFIAESSKIGEIKEKNLFSDIKYFSVLDLDKGKYRLAPNVITLKELIKTDFFKYKF